MDKIIEFFRNWFEKNGIIKILIAFIILGISISLYRKFPQNEWLSWIGSAAGIYIGLTGLIFTIAGIVNAINDFIKRKKK